MIYIQHAADLWSAHPGLVAGVVAATGITPDGDTGAAVEEFTSLALARLATGQEAAFPEIQAWRRAFTRMGLRPTQYRCASEALLRRLRKDGELPRIHPLIDLCNAISTAFAIPVAALDVTRVSKGLDVRHAHGDETYHTLSGETEHPVPGEVIFADAAGHAHARRWTNRQSGHSAVRDTTASVLIVAEAMHESAAEDVPRLIGALTSRLSEVFGGTPSTALLTATAPRAEFPV
ncbi:phenylalanine--tRNA ligase beta subunit-related protein [Sphaerisporangium rubeum]|uniref:DNA/RNA-binding domain of Phe-tRNA-synthetase-like protein n=1 Tax=Sphaerisporangium rubeum TaxID=321317 RepID=A0A7X0M742_9ACTN|nr:phenylalanine--tRNA ligase beta subunit-related protein [Sphaerisporangium rubeum]MBB6473912.1 DNA/RNA-binding domain of Phe-tRNA-synthetase-like protein [Sphaerisporangium rubeum]